MHRRLVGDIELCPMHRKQVHLPSLIQHSGLLCCAICLFGTNRCRSEIDWADQPQQKPSAGDRLRVEFCPPLWHLPCTPRPERESLVVTVAVSSITYAHFEDDVAV